MLGFSSQRSSPHSHSYTRTTKARRTSEIIAARRTSPLHFRQRGGAAENDGSCALSSTLSPIAPLSVATVPAWCQRRAYRKPCKGKAAQRGTANHLEQSVPPLVPLKLGKPVLALTTNRFRVFSTTNQNDFGIVSFRVDNEISSQSCEKLRDVMNINDNLPTLR